MTVTAEPGSTSLTSATSPLKIQGWVRAVFTPGVLLLAQDDDHDDGVPGALEDLLGLEAEEPLDELEAAGQLDQGPELLREHHARQVGLAVKPSRAVLDRLEGHALAKD